MAPRKKSVTSTPPSDAAQPNDENKIEKVECPPELGVVARQEWERVAPHLVAAGRLTVFDRGPLAVYCVAYAGWLEAVVALQTYGTVMKSPSGYPLQSPYVSIATKHADTMTRIASEFGFTPASRHRLPGGRSDSQFFDVISMEELGADLLPLK